MKIRIKFSKYGTMKYIGHLDMMRFFQKAIRRAGIDVKYSEGFSPHQIMSFAAPLGAGQRRDPGLRHRGVRVGLRHDGRGEAGPGGGSPSGRRGPERPLG